MADFTNSGVMKPPAMLKSDDYRSWAMELKANLNVLGCWGMVEGTYVAPPPTAPAESTNTEIAAHMRERASWDSKWDRAAALLVVSVSGEE